MSTPAPISLESCFYLCDEDRGIIQLTSGDERPQSHGEQHRRLLKIARALASLSVQNPADEVYAVSVILDAHSLQICIAGNDAVPQQTRDHLEGMLNMLTTSVETLESSGIKALWALSLGSAASERLVHNT